MRLTVLAITTTVVIVLQVARIYALQIESDALLQDLNQCLSQEITHAVE